jgi:UbiD family decarboxylase
VPQDLRAFLALAEQRGHLLRISRGVDADTEAAALLYELERAGKVGLIEHVRGRTGRLALNLLGRRDLLAAALRCGTEEIVPRFAELVERRVPTQRVSEPVPSQEVVLRGDEADLRKLPLIVHADKDAGEYVSAGLVLAKGRKIQKPAAATSP